MMAIRMIGRNVLQRKGIAGVMCDMLRYCKAEILQTLEVLIDTNVYPLVVHCTQGKDRTGLVVILVCLVVGGGERRRGRGERRGERRRGRGERRGERGERDEDEEEKQEMKTEKGGDPVPIEAIQNEYVLSNDGLKPIRNQLLEEIRAAGMREDYVDAPPELVYDVCRFLDEEYGGVENYLDEIGFNEKKRDMLRCILEIGRAHV